KKQRPAGQGKNLKVMLSSMFRSLYEFGVDSINFSDVVVSKSPINPMGCVIIKARKPIEWLLDHCSRLNMDSCWLSAIDIRQNSDGSISVIDKSVKFK